MKGSIEKVAEFKRFGSVLGLERMIKLLELLGNPHDKLQVIHVAGTNGKGSTCRFIYDILKENGYKVGLYTSPFIDDFNERIEYCGECISNEDLDKCTTSVLNAAEKMVQLDFDSPTEFEIITAIALLFYSKKNADFVVLEVGLGGKGDSTNIIKKPVATIITSISYDHMDRLGETIEEIASEKAGIIKEGVPVFINTKNKIADKVIAKIAYEKKAPLIDASRLKYTRRALLEKGELFSVKIGESFYKDVKLSMIGEHQVSNAILALAAIEFLRKNSIISVDKCAIYSALLKTKNKGRFEIVNRKVPYVLDGAHNKGGMEVLVRAMRETFRDKKVLTIMGVLADKDMDSMIEEVGQISQDFIATQPDNPRRLRSEELAQIIKSNKMNCTIKESASEAIKEAARVEAYYDVVLCVGSLYLIGEIRRLINDSSK